MIWALALSTLLHPAMTTVRGDDPFATARYMAADVDGYIHIASPSRLRSQLQDEPLGAAIMHTLEGSSLLRAWNELARITGAPPEHLFETVLGRDLTLVYRLDEQRQVHWAALVEMSDEDWVAFARSVRPRTLRSKWGIALRHLPEQELLMARKDDLVLIGPDPKFGGSLFDEIMPHLLEPRHPNSLANHVMIMKPPALDGAMVGVYLRHRGPIGGCTVAAIALECGEVKVALSGRYDASPLVHTPQPLEFDADLIDALSRRELSVIALPQRFPSGPFGTFLRARMPPGVITDAIRSGMGRRMLMVIGEDDERRVEIGLMLEIDSEPCILSDLDRLIVVTVNQLRDAVDSPQRRDHPFRWRRAEPDEVRSTRVGDIAPHLLPMVNHADEMTLCWTRLAQDDRTQWLIMTTSRGMVERIRRTATEPDLALRTRTVGALWGRVNTAASLPHLHAVIERTAGMAADQADADVPGGVDVLRFIERILGAYDEFEWSVETPEPNVVRSNMSLRKRTQEGGGRRSASDQ